MHIVHPDLPDGQYSRKLHHYQFLTNFYFTDLVRFLLEILEKSHEFAFVGFIRQAGAIHR